MRTSLAATARRFLRWEFVPEAVLFAGLTAFFLHQTDAATSAFKSTKAVAIMAAVAIGWLGARVLLARLVPFALARAAVFSVAAAVALSVVVFPAYDNKTVVETLPTAAAAPLPPATGPQPLRSGAFRGIDHRASGTVVIYRQPDRRFVIGLEDIDIQPGPDYDLYVVPGADRRDTKGGSRLGDLRGNRGTQFYDVPAGVDLEAGPWTVLVWCQTFAVPVANTTPS
jgi:electron transfer DM13